MARSCPWYAPCKQRLDMTDPTRWLRPEFWSNVFQDTARWAMTAVPRILVVLLVAWILLKLLDVVMKRVHKKAAERGDEDDSPARREHEKRVETLTGIVKKTGQIMIWGIVLMLLLLQVGVEIAPLIAGAGIIGLAVGFGAQELVRDVITGFFMLLENHVRVGDVAIVNGTGGLVERIGLRTVVLRDLSGTVHIFQNGKISSLANMTKDWSAMVFDIGVAYKEDTDVATRVIQEVADELRADPEFAPKILEPMEIFGVDSFGDSAVIIKARFKTRPIEQWSVGREYNRRLKKAFDAQGIEIPFPHRTVYFGEASPPFKVVGAAEDG